MSIRNKIKFDEIFTLAPPKKALGKKDKPCRMQHLIRVYYVCIKYMDFLKKKKKSPGTNKWRTFSS